MSPYFPSDCSWPDVNPTTEEIWIRAALCSNPQHTIGSPSSDFSRNGTHDALNQKRSTVGKITAVFWNLLRCNGIRGRAQLGSRIDNTSRIRELMRTRSKKERHEGSMEPTCRPAQIKPWCYRLVGDAADGWPSDSSSSGFSSLTKSQSSVRSEPK